MEYAAPMDVTEGAAERGEEMEYLCLCERHLAPGTLDAVDQVAPCAKLHHNDHRAATVVVPVEEDVLKPDNARMLDPLKAGGFEQRLVRRIDCGAPDILEHIRSATPHHEQSLSETSSTEGAALAVSVAAPVAAALLPRMCTLPHDAADSEPSDEHSAAAQVEEEHRRFG